MIGFKTKRLHISLLQKWKGLIVKRTGFRMIVKMNSRKTAVYEN